MSKLKNRLTVVLLAVFIALMSIAVTDLATKAKAAETAYPTEGTFEIVDGISLKLNDEGGMRWVLKVSDEIYEYASATDAGKDRHIGIIIAPKKLFDAVTDGNYSGMKVKIMGRADISKAYKQTKDDGCYYFNFCVKNMKETNRTYDYAAVGYYTDDSGNIVRYTTLNENSVNNFYNVANKSILYSGKDYSEKMLGLKSYDWLGTENYPIMVSDAAQYETLKARQTNGFQDKYYEFSSDLDYKADDFSELGNNVSRYGVETAPVANEGLAYTGSAQTLVQAGVAVGTNCKILYKLGNGEWSETTPAATNAGEYTVYYKGVSGSLETAEKSVTVNVAKAENKVTIAEGADFNFTYGGQPNEKSATSTAGEISYTYTLADKNSVADVGTIKLDENAEYSAWSDSNISGLYYCKITASETENYKSAV